MQFALFHGHYKVQMTEVRHDQWLLTAVTNLLLQWIEMWRVSNQVALNQLRDSMRSENESPAFVCLLQTVCYASEIAEKSMDCEIKGFVVWLRGAKSNSK